MPAGMPPRDHEEDDGIRLTMQDEQHDEPAAPKTTPDIARDLSSVDRNRQTRAGPQRPHEQRPASEIRIVTKSMPPSRKLIAMNGAIAANSVASLTPCASSLPIDDAARRQRGQRDQLERLLHPLVAQRVERAERHDRQAEQRQDSPSAR